MNKNGNFNTKGETNVSGKSSDTILHESKYLNEWTNIGEPGKANWNELEDMAFRSDYGSKANDAEFKHRLDRSSVKLRLARLSLAA